MGTENGNGKEMENAGNAEQKFTKKQIVASERYRDRKDLVNALLEEGKTYTPKMVDGMIDKYMKRKVM